MDYKNSFSYYLILLVALGQSFPAFAKPTPTPTQAPVVVLKNFSFNPRKLTVTEGTTVKWVDKQAGVVHDIDSDDGVSFESPELVKGDKFSHTFQTVGRFPYHCSFHGDVGGFGMSGVVIVKKKTIKKN